MSLGNKIESNKKIKPTIYAYTIPDYAKKDGWVKVGYTTRDADKRIGEQVGTADIGVKKLWDFPARFQKGPFFTDHDFHHYLVQRGIKRKAGTEWFYFGPGEEHVALELYKDFCFEDYEEVQKHLTKDYILRREQDEAVAMTLDYAKHNPGGKFLWNAKPRFGKTLSTYDLVRKLDAVNVLVVTNRPAIANSWFDDFERFIAWQTDYKFVSESESLKDRHPMSREEFTKHLSVHPEARQINFLSLQDLKGSKYHGGGYDKLRFVSEIEWDILIIDEAHEGIDTLKTDIAFDNITRDFTLHLSGTPFKAIASGDFNYTQIYNWSYEDEQRAKNNWKEEENNPYEDLPKLNMFTYQMSRMILDEITEGANIDGKEVDYAFDLNEFFSTKDSGTFVYEDDVKKWLNTLTSNDKYPFATSDLRNELRHTFWMLNRVSSAKALAKLLNEHPVFENYEVIVAAGDGQLENDDKITEKSLNRVKKAIKDYDKTITLSVGQLTTGVTIPEWSAVLMLSNMKSSALYMQAAFRAQNPYRWTDTSTGDAYRKEHAYVFDFAPERTLTIFDEFANNLHTDTTSGGGTTKKREENIKELLNFFPVIGEDMDGTMKELDFNDVITIPKAIKATEVVKRGFMSNLLFSNISGIFGAPQAVLETIDKMEKEEGGRSKRTTEKTTNKGVKVDDEGNALIDEDVANKKADKVLGDKIYKTKVKLPKNTADLSKDDLKKRVTEAILSTTPLKEIYEDARKKTGLSKKDIKEVQKEFEKKLDHVVERDVVSTNNKKYELEKRFHGRISESTDKEEIQKLNQDYEDALEALYDEFKEDVELNAAIELEESVQNIMKNDAQKEVDEKKKSVEDSVRAHLRGFSRTIPSFLMAYGTDALTLNNFETIVDNDVFKEVTGITIKEFIFLRDGGDYVEDGETKHYDGGLFDEVVFNEAVQEFLRKKKELANYFEDTKEDIFDYIPPQKTNQIFTPKHVVKMMVDALEKENPDIFDDSSKTFCDLYMKSGLYITEIVKRLYNSDVINREFPDDKERIKHILENQVYGFAPSEIIYRIATNFIFGELDADISRKNFKSIDTAPYAKEGTMQELIDREFGE